MANMWTLLPGQQPQPRPPTPTGSISPSYQAMLDAWDAYYGPGGIYQGGTPPPTSTTPPPERPSFFSPVSPEQQAQLDAWDAMYGPNATQPPPPTPTPTPTPTPNPGGGGSGQLPGYGLSQGFGIPGFETKPMVGGGSWEGTTWNPPAAPSYSWGGGGGATGGTGLGTGSGSNPIELGPLSPDGSGVRASPGNVWFWRGTMDQNGGGTPTGDWIQVPGGSTATGGTTGGNTTVGTTTTGTGLTINPPVPYNTTDYRQAYPDKLAPWPNIHAQIGAAMQGIEPAKPGFNWASPQALAGLGGYGLPGGWTSMLGFTPGGNK
jgi:hypothetical protein